MSISEIQKRYGIPRRYCGYRNSEVTAGYGRVWLSDSRIFINYMERGTHLTDLRRRYAIRDLKKRGLISLSIQDPFGFTAEIKRTALRCALRIIGAIPKPDRTRNRSNLVSLPAVEIVAQHADAA